MVGGGGRDLDFLGGGADAGVGESFLFLREEEESRGAVGGGAD